MRFLRWVFTVWLFLVALIGGTVLYGRAGYTKPSELRASHFDVCDGKPCFMGIVPGVTRLEDVKQQFFKQIVRVKQGSFDIRVEDVQVFIGPADDPSTSSPVQWLTFAKQNLSHPSLFTLAYLIERFGLPCNIATGDTGTEPFVEIVYPLFIAKAALQQGRLSVDAPIVYVVMRDPTTIAVLRNKLGATYCNEKHTPWLGLASTLRYRAYKAGLTARITE